MSENEINQNSLLLKIVIGLLGVSGTLLTFIGIGIITKIEDMQKDIKALSPISLQHTTQIETLIHSVSDLQGQVREMEKTNAQFTALYALKPDDIVVRRKRNNGAIN